jgi:hypothetical protein
MPFNPEQFGAAVGRFVDEECKRLGIPDDAPHAQLIARWLVHAAGFLLAKHGLNNVQQAIILTDAVGRVTKLPVATVEADLKGPGSAKN